jgi:hypothetical protein
MNERNIYLIRRNDAQHIGYDEYDSHVVIADNPYKAREMCPSGDEGAVWTRTELTDCKFIGKSKLKPQVVLSSFNAG